MAIEFDKKTFECPPVFDSNDPLTLSNLKDEVRIFAIGITNLVSKLVKAHNELEERLADHAISINSQAQDIDRMWSTPDHARLRDLEESAATQAQEIAELSVATYSPIMTDSSPSPIGWKIAQNPNQTIKFPNSNAKLIEENKQMKDDIRAFLSVLATYSPGMDLPESNQYCQAVKNLKRHVDD